MRLETRISREYRSLSETLRSAADFVAANRFEVATRSLRSIAGASGISPTSYSRLARALGYEDYEMLREQARREIEEQTGSFSEKAAKLKEDAADASLPHFLDRQAEACIANISSLVRDTSRETLEAAVSALADARKVVLAGSLGSASMTDYFSYMASWLDNSWDMVGRRGSTTGSMFVDFDERDTLLVISMAPYADLPVQAAKLAAEQGATVIAITDSHAFPGLEFATHMFIQKTGSPQFFSSYGATLVLLETMTGMLVARSGPEAEEKIRAISRKNRALSGITDI